MKKNLKKQKKTIKPASGIRTSSSSRLGSVTVPKNSEPVFKLTPLGDRVIIKEKKDTHETTTASGIIIPASVQDDKGSKRGVVVAVSSGHYDDGVLIAPSVSVGDAVLYTWGDNVKVDGEDYVIVRENDIIAVVN